MQIIILRANIPLTPHVRWAIHISNVRNIYEDYNIIGAIRFDVITLKPVTQKDDIVYHFQCISSFQS